MKRILCLFLSLSILFILFGCQKNDSKIVKTFYYPRNDLGYNQQEDKFYASAIQAELRQDVPYQSSVQILVEYLKGPLDPTLYNPFPSDLALTNMTIQGEVLYVTVSDHLASLRDIPLMLACACLAKTAMSVTGATTVCISCTSSLLNGEKYIIMNTDSIIFDDPVITEPNG